MTLAHRVALLEKGVLQQLDTPAKIYNSPANLFVAGFIGSPPMNLLDGELADGQFSSAAGNFPTQSRASPRVAVAGRTAEYLVSVFTATWYENFRSLCDEFAEVGV